MGDPLDKDIEAWKKAKDSKIPTLVSYVTSLKKMYDDKPVTPEAPAKTAPNPAPEKKKTKPIMGGANPDLDPSVREEM